MWTQHIFVVYASSWDDALDYLEDKLNQDIESQHLDSFRIFGGFDSKHQVYGEQLSEVPTISNTANFIMGETQASLLVKLLLARMNDVKKYESLPMDTYYKKLTKGEILELQEGYLIKDYLKMLTERNTILTVIQDKKELTPEDIPLFEYEYKEFGLTRICEINGDMKLEGHKTFYMYVSFHS